jgi:HlyD family secretion protein
MIETIALVLVLAVAPADSATLSLADAVGHALAEHPSVGAARAGQEAAAAGVGEAKAGLFPRVTGSLSWSRARYPSLVYPLHGLSDVFVHPPVFDRDLTQGSLSLGYTLWDFGARGARIRAARAQEGKAEAALEGSESALIARVADAYLGVLTAAGVREAQRQNVAALQAEADRVAQLEAQGRAARVEALRVAAEVSRARADLVTTTAQLDASERGLARLTGLPAAATRAARLREPALSDTSTAARDTLVARALSASPDVRQARRAAEAARASAGVARAAWFPELRVSAAYLDYGSAWRDFRPEWNAALQLSYPIFTGLGRLNAARRSEAEARAAGEQARLAELGVEQELDAALADRACAGRGAGDGRGPGGRGGADPAAHARGGLRDRDRLPGRRGEAAAEPGRAGPGPARGDRGADRADAGHRPAHAGLADGGPGGRAITERRNMNRKRIVPVIVVVVLAAVLYFVLRPRGQGGALAASGTVEATDAQLGFQTAGRIDTILVHEGDPVRTRQELARLDTTELRARRQQAAGQQAGAGALLEELERGSRSQEIQQGRDALAAANQRLADAQRDLDRTRRLLDGGAVSREALDKAQLAFDVAQSARDQAAQAYDLLRTGPRPERIAAQRAALAQADAAVAQIDALLANAIVRAPFDGVVTVRDREPGEIVPAGSPVLTVTNLDDRWVRIYIPETRIGAVHLGQPATITADTFPGRTYGGEVSFIASEAEFTPKNVQTRDERVKLVYAVKVRITRDASYDLKPGVPADVELQPGTGARP